MAFNQASLNGDTSYKRQRTDNDGASFGNNQFRRKEPEKPNHILLLTVLNPAYPISVEVIESVCKLYGEVQRIVIIRKRGVQAMVEYRNIETASRAKEGLHGADIYSGCCTLRVEFGKADRLNVMRNGPDSWDFTVTEEQRNGGGPPRQGLLGDSPTGMQGAMQGGMGNMQGAMGNMQGAMGNRMDTNDMQQGLMGGRPNQGMGRMNDTRGNMPFEGQDKFGGNRGMGRDSFAGAGGNFMGGGSQKSPVLMVYGLNKDKLNCDGLFNILCLYGNVNKVKFLKTKEGCAMVEMGDGLAVERALANLNNSTFFGSQLALGYSKQEFLTDVQQPYELPDGSPSFKNFMGNKNNRFMNPDTAHRNRIMPPCKTLHFFNTPPGIEDSTIQQIFFDKDMIPPKKTTLLPSKSEKSSRGLLEFNNVTEALEALIGTNHSPISNDDNSRYPFIMKLSFSSNRGNE